MENMFFGPDITLGPSLSMETVYVALAFKDS